VPETIADRYSVFTSVQLYSHAPTLALQTWGIGGSRSEDLRNDAAGLAAEKACELKVSDYIGAMPVCWVDVADESSPKSARSEIERNSIALLSNKLAPVDLPSPSWLGRSSPRREIRDSGLWNLNYVSDTCDPRFLDTFERLLEQMA
jgi:hypothetical protein